MHVPPFSHGFVSTHGAGSVKIIIDRKECKFHHFNNSQSASFVLCAVHLHRGIGRCDVLLMACMLFNRPIDTTCEIHKNTHLGNFFIRNLNLQCVFVVYPVQFCHTCRLLIHYKPDCIQSVIQTEQQTIAMCACVVIRTCTFVL